MCYSLIPPSHPSHELGSIIIYFLQVREGPTATSKRLTGDVNSGQQLTRAQTQPLGSSVTVLLVLCHFNPPFSLLGVFLQFTFLIGPHPFPDSHTISSEDNVSLSFPSFISLKKS